MQTATIRFLGGAGRVTGSNFLFDTGGAKFLIDCGLYQGITDCEAKNWDAFDFDIASIAAVIVTHAHIDHIGRIPKLVRDGYTGPIFSTKATRDLAEPLLLDSMELLQGSAQQLGRPVLYDEKNIADALKQWQTLPYHEPHALGDGVSVELLNTGHILGSAMAKLTRGDKSIVFTGDLGNGSEILPACEIPHGIDYLLMESVYGDRVRKDTEHRREKLEDVIENTAARGGTLVIPAFSTERTQDLLFDVRALMLEKRVPSMPVYVDSPLATKITEAFLKNPSFFKDEIRQRIEKGENIFSFPELRFTETVAASREAMRGPSPKIFIAGSGMSNGGRVLEHEKQVLPDPKSTLLIVGYQPAGSLGRQLLEGANTVDIHGETLHVRCRVDAVFGYSAHMDGPHLLDFVSEIDGKLQRVFVVMGEPAAASFLAQRIRDYLGIESLTPEAGESAEISF